MNTRQYLVTIAFLLTFMAGNLGAARAAEPKIEYASGLSAAQKKKVGEALAHAKKTEGASPSPELLHRMQCELTDCEPLPQAKKSNPSPKK